MTPPSAPSDPPVTLITGGSSGIGLATAHALRKKGHRLALVARRPEPLEEARAALAGDDESAVMTIAGDIADPAWEGAIVHAVVDRFGRLDHMVHAAGMAPLAPLEETDTALMRKVFHVNAMGPIELTRRALPVFRQQHKTGLPGGTIVTISSYASADPFPGFLAYAGAKAALNVMTSVLAAELAELGMTAYAVAPAGVETPMLRGLFSKDDLPESQTLNPEDVAALVVRCLERDVDQPAGATLFIKQTDTGVQITDQPV